MTRRNKHQRPAAAEAGQTSGPQAPAPQPVSMVDGIPNRSARRPAWVLVLLALVFLAWVAVLVLIHLSGNV